MDVYIPPNTAMQFLVERFSNKQQVETPFPVWVLPAIPHICSCGCGCLEMYPVLINSIPKHILVDPRPGKNPMVCKCMGHLIE